MGKASAIVRRRKAVQNIRKITHTMQLIATAAFQKAFNRAVATRPYSEKITELVQQLSASQQELEHPLLRVNSGAGRSALLGLTSNRGLCGGYNASLLRTAMAHIRTGEVPDSVTGREGEAVDLAVTGKKGIAYFRFTGRSMAATYTQFGYKPTFAQVDPIAEDYIRRYAAGEIDAVHVVYMQFESTSVQRPTTLQLLPLERAKPGEEPQTGETAAPRTFAQYDFSPSAPELLAELLPATVKARLLRCFVDAAVSEQVARMVAMKAATDASDDMLKQLTQAYNRARQSQITLELLDIVGGAEALK